MQNTAPAAQLSDALTLSPSGGTHVLKLPSGFSGTITFGPNSAPAGTRVELGIAGALLSQRADKSMVVTHTDPFPIILNIRLPITVTLPIPSFSLTFPSWVTLAQGTFDVAIFDPTQPQGSSNPLFLGKAVVSGQTLTFTAPPGLTYLFKAGVKYSLTIARDTGGSNVVLPLSSGANAQLLPANGTLGAPQVNTNSSNSGFVQWTIIPFGPKINNTQGVESLVVQSTQSLSLSNTTVNVSYNPSATSTPVPGSANTFVPDPSPTVFGPFDLTSTGPNQAQFTVPNSLPLTSGHKWAFVVLSVTVCVPSNVLLPCDSTNPSNNATSINPGQQYDVLVSDQSGLLGGPNYSVDVSGSTPDGSATVDNPCSFVSEAGDNGDHPSGYNDNWPNGPNTEFEVFSGLSSPAACTFVVSYNGVPVASENVGVGTSLSLEMKSKIMHRMFARPPTKAGGTAISGT